MKLDPHNPNVRALASLVDELAWQIATTRTQAECEDLVRRVEAQRQIRKQMFRPVPIARPAESA